METIISNLNQKMKNLENKYIGKPFYFKIWPIFTKRNFLTKTQVLLTNDEIQIQIEGILGKDM